jgi:hypothetical protein
LFYYTNSGNTKGNVKMKQILKALLILTAFTALQVNAENESYTANLDDIAIQG